MVGADLNPDDDFDCRDQQLPRPGAIGSATAPASRWTCAGRARPVRSTIGSRLALRTDAATYRRAIRVGSGYLSSDPPRVHFGFPREPAPEVAVRGVGGALLGQTQRSTPWPGLHSE